MGEGLQHLREGSDARQVLAGESLELCSSVVGDSEVDLTVVGAVAGTIEQTGIRGALGELDGAVMANVQLLGDFADRWPVIRGMAANGEQ